MYAPYQIPKPKNWQDLETLCLAIWRKEWNTKSFKMYGRPGQHQDGVDVFGRYDDGLEFGAIQCKCKEEEKKLTKSIIKAEVDKAKNFKPTIKRYVIATTFDSDTKLDTYVAELCQQNLKAGSFSIELFGWQDIERLLELHTDVRDWYLNLTKRREQTCEVEVVEPGDMTLRPVFRRTHYLPKAAKDAPRPQYTVMDLFGMNKLNALMQPYQKLAEMTEAKLILGEIYHARCRIKLLLKNKSEVTMKDVRVEVHATEGAKFYLIGEKRDMRFEMTEIALANRMSVDEDRVNYYHMADYHPKDDRILHEFYVEPPYEMEDIELKIHITAQDFVDDQVVKLKVEPQYHLKYCYIDEKVGEPDDIEPYVEILN